MKSMNVVVYICFIVLSVIANRPTVALLPLQGSGVSESETMIITSRLEVEMFKLGTYMVLERKEMGAILEEQEFQQSGCVSAECAVEVGQILGVSHMLSGSVSNISGSYYIDVKLTDIATTEVLNHQAVTLDDISFSELLSKQIPSLARKISGIEDVSMILVSTFDKHNHILMNGEQIGSSSQAVHVPYGEYYFSEIDRKTGLEQNSETVTISDSLPQRIHLGGKRVSFTFGPSMSIVFPGTANPIPYKDGRPSFSSTFLAPGFQVGVLIADKHYHGFISHMRLGTEIETDKKDWEERSIGEPQVRSLYLGGFYQYQREWRLGSYFKLGAGGAVGLRANAISYIVPKDNAAAYDKKYTSEREEFGGVLLSMGVGSKKVQLVTSMLYVLGIHQINTEEGYWGESGKEWLSSTTRRGHTRVSASPELQVALRIIR